MNIVDVEKKLRQRIERARLHHITDGPTILWAMENTHKELCVAIYGPENPEASANSLGKCAKCGQLLPRQPADGGH